MYNFILKILTPFIKFIGKMHYPFTHKKITGKEYYLLRDKIEIGTVFLTKTYGELSNLINPLKLKHGAIYVGRIEGDEVCYVAEATGKGVVFTDLVTFLTSKDIVVITKPKLEVIPSQIQFAARAFRGIPYDYLFISDKKAFYCFELVAMCFKRAKPDLNLKEKEIIKGKRVYDANTFLDENLFNVVYDSREK